MQELHFYTDKVYAEFDDLRYIRYNCQDIYENIGLEG